MAVPPPAVTVVMVMTVTMPMIVVMSLCAGIDRVGGFAEWSYWRRDGARCCRKSQHGGVVARRGRKNETVPDRILKAQASPDVKNHADRIKGAPCRDEPERAGR